MNRCPARRTAFGSSLAARPVAVAILAAVAAGGLVGCKSAPPDPGITGSLDPMNYRRSYPIVLAEGEETLDIPVGFGAPGLSQPARDNVRQFAADAITHATSDLVILTPRGSGNEAAAGMMAGQARDIALKTGMKPGQVRMDTYPVVQQGIASPIRLSFVRIKAMSPPCGSYTGQALPGFGNGASENFGCATQANLAAMVAEPEDLITPRAVTAAPAGRRFFQFKKWVEGDATASTKESADSETTEGGS